MHPYSSLINKTDHMITTTTPHKPFILIISRVFTSCPTQILVPFLVSETSDLKKLKLLIIPTADV